jgi:hypothetical protein
LLGKVAFVRTTGEPLNPAVAAALTHELEGFYDVVCVQADADEYVAAVINPSAKRGYGLGQRIPLTAVKEHVDPWSTC